MIKILIADDHEIVRCGIKQILQDEFPEETIEEAMDTDTLINKAISSHWDIIVSDLKMPGGGGLAAIRKIHDHQPLIPVLILSFYPEEQYVLSLLKAGAAGFLNKDAASEKLINAVKIILSGHNYFSCQNHEKGQCIAV